MVTAGQGALFPAAPFNAVIWPAGAQPLSTNAEIVRVTARATDTLTITRTQEGTSARTVVVGDQIMAAITAKTLTDIEAIDPLVVHLAGNETITGVKTFSANPTLSGTATRIVAKTYTATDYSQFLITSALSTDTTGNRMEVYPWGSIWFGPGGAAATDCGIERGAAGTIYVWGGGLGAARMLVGSTVIVRNASGADRLVGWEALTSTTAASGAIANTETVVVSVTLPANLMQAGTTFRIVASGVGTAAGATAGSTWRVRVGSTTLTGTIPASLTGTSAAGTNIPFMITALVTVRTAGASGTIIGSIVYNSNAATGNLNTTIAVGQVTTAVAVDTTASKLLELTYISGAAGTTSTYHNAVIELVKG